MRLELRADLNNVAARMVRSQVERIAGEVRDEAQRNAPAAKVWISARDDRVRPSHEHADGQTIPANLRFQLRRMFYVRKGRGEDGKAINFAGGWYEASGFDLARWPRDPDLPRDQLIRCRCESQELPGVIARRIRAGTAVVDGPRARARVAVRFERIVESELGTSKDRGTHFMANAVDAVARRYRVRR